MLYPNQGSQKNMGNIRALVLSDIHNNIEHVKILRQKEDNVYDVIVIAGDIGKDIKHEFFQLIDSFKCPSFCVFGNWDHDFEYDVELSKNCKLIHHNVETVNGFYFTGFSGCTANWGRNPTYIEEIEKLNKKHNFILSLIEKELQKDKLRRTQIREKYDEKLANLDRRTKDRRKKEYREKRTRIKLSIERENKKSRKPVEHIYSSAEYSTYKMEKYNLYELVFLKNKERLFNSIRKSKIPPNRLVIITHERIYKIAEQGLTPLLHIFGHIHKYKINRFKGTHYLNAAAIDNGNSIFFERKETLPEGYCSVEITPSHITVERKNILE